jgi:DNA repair photolyase
MKRFSMHEEAWGHFVDVKINATEVLEKDLLKIKPGERAFLSSVTDAYLPLERKYKLTRSILEKIAQAPEDLFHSGFSVSILTKSDLVLRDQDILTQIPGSAVGFSIAMTNERASRLFEPRCSPIRQRIAALKTLHEAGIRTYAFIGPILPGITDLSAIFSSLEGIVEYVFGETLNTRCGNLSDIFRTVSAFDEKLLPQFEKNIRDNRYWLSIEREFHNLAKSHHIPVTGFLHHPER